MEQNKEKNKKKIRSNNLKKKGTKKEQKEQKITIRNNKEQ